MTKEEEEKLLNQFRERLKETYKKEFGDRITEKFFEKKAKNA